MRYVQASKNTYKYTILLLITSVMYQNILCTFDIGTRALHWKEYVSKLFFNKHFMATVLVAGMYMYFSDFNPLRWIVPKTYDKATIMKTIDTIEKTYTSFNQNNWDPAYYRSYIQVINKHLSTSSELSPLTIEEIADYFLRSDDPARRDFCTNLIKKEIQWWQELFLYDYHKNYREQAIKYLRTLQKNLHCLNE